MRNDKSKMDAVWEVVSSNMKSLDKMMVEASDEIRDINADCSSHILSSMMIRQLAHQMARYYDVLKIKELFQEILDEESKAALEIAKENRARIKLN